MTVRSYVRPHMMIPLSMAFCRRRSEVSSLLLQDFPANLTSGGMVIPTTVPHSGRESFQGTAPLCVDGAKAPRRTTATFPRITGLRCCCGAARFRRRLDGGLRDRTFRHHTVDDNGFAKSILDAPGRRAKRFCVIRRVRFWRSWLGKMMRPPTEAALPLFLNRRFFDFLADLQQKLDEFRRGGTFQLLLSTGSCAAGILWFGLLIFGRHWDPKYARTSVDRLTLSLTLGARFSELAT